MRRALVAAFLALGTAAAQAEVYTWRDASGVKLSNVAPAWYSETGRTGPRVQVTLNGILIDDTGLPDEQRAKLREQRAKAETWGGARPATATPAPQAPTAAVAAPAAAAPAADPKAKPPPPPLPGGIDPAKAGDGLKRALETQKQLDASTSQAKK